MAIRYLIVDDEMPGRMNLRLAMEAHPDWQLVGECGGAAAARAALAAQDLDLLFLDIQMPEMDGFEVLQAIENVPRAVIFITAFDQYAVRAFDVAAVDYLLKPIDPHRFREALARAKEKLVTPREMPQPDIAALLEQLRTEPRYQERFVVRSSEQVSFVRTADVSWIEATGNYVRLFAAGRTHIVRDTMKAVEARLDPARFVRIHRSVIVQIDRIASMQPYFHGEWIITMEDGARFTSSRSYNERVRLLLK